MHLPHERFALGVENVGASMTYFNQMDTYGKRVYMTKGVCRALSAYWLRAMKLKNSGSQVPDETQRTEEISWLAEQQHKKNESVDMYLRANGLRPDGMIWFKTQVDWGKLRFFLAARPGYYLVGVDAQGNGEGHEIAFCTVNTWKLFDPNYGIVTFQSQQTMHQFLTAYWGRAYPDLANGSASIFRYV